jgi:HEAT repeats/HEAT repeat
MSDHQPDIEAVGGGRRFRARVAGLVILIALFAVWIGWRIWDPYAGPDPMRLLRYGDVSERSRAALDLSAGAPGWTVAAVIPALINALDDQDADVRATAARSLELLISAARGVNGTGLGPPEAVEQYRDATIHALVKALNDRDANVRSAAALGLGSIGKVAAITPTPELTAALKDESATVRAAAAGALSNFTGGSDSMIPGLLTMMENDEAIVRDACAGALRSA